MSLRPKKGCAALSILGVYIHYHIPSVYHPKKWTRLGCLLSYLSKLICIFFHVWHSCSSTQSWGRVLPSIVEKRDKNSQGCPLLFSNSYLGSFCAWRIEILYTHSLWEVLDHSGSNMHETCPVYNYTTPV